MSILKSTQNSIRIKLDDSVFITFFVSLIILNWKPLYFLISSNQNPENKIQYIENQFNNGINNLLWALTITGIYGFIYPFVLICIDFVKYQYLNSEEKRKTNLLKNVTLRNQEEFNAESARSGAKSLTELNNELEDKNLLIENSKSEINKLTMDLSLNFEEINKLKNYLLKNEKELKDSRIDNEKIKNDVINLMIKNEDVIEGFESKIENLKSKFLEFFENEMGLKIRFSYNESPLTNLANINERVLLNFLHFLNKEYIHVSDIEKNTYNDEIKKSYYSKLFFTLIISDGYFNPENSDLRKFAYDYGLIDKTDDQFLNEKGDLMVNLYLVEKYEVVKKN